MLLCFIHPWTIASPLDRHQNIDFSFYKPCASVSLATSNFNWTGYEERTLEVRLVNNASVFLGFFFS